MANQFSGMSTAVGEFRRFVTSLGTFWGVLTGTAMLFPLANTFVGAVPVGLWDQYTPRGGLVYISPEILAATATLGASFTTLWLFSHRDEFAADLDRGAVRRRALVSSASAYVRSWCTSSRASRSSRGTVLGGTMDNPHRIAGDVVPLLSYGGFFVLTTRTFVLLGVLEYYQTG